MKEALLYEKLENDRVKCRACARYCNIPEGKIGLCGIRQNIGGKLCLLVYGKVIAAHVDPIEKKPVTHYMPGSRIFSIGTTGCSWLCQYCFTPETMVLTDNGFITMKRIYDTQSGLEDKSMSNAVKVSGLKVLTHKGFWRDVEQVFRHYYVGQIIVVKPLYFTEIKCTPNHKFLVYDFNSENLREIKAEDLRQGHYLVVPKMRIKLNEELILDVKAILSQASSNLPKHRPLIVNCEEVHWSNVKTSLLDTEKYYLLPIKRVKRGYYEGYVYNLQVAEEHTYLTNLIAVCNCQNYDISQRRKVEGMDMSPEKVVSLTEAYRCQGIAYTYNEPTIFIEFAHDAGVIARSKGLINIFVSNGYCTPDSVNMMNDFLDCITVDFKGNGEPDFLRRYVGIPNAEPVFQTLLEIRDKTNIHTEITDLIVPKIGDNIDEARKLSEWIYENLGPDIPIHFLRFHPDYKLTHLPSTPIETLEKHYKVAREIGLNYVYIGNAPGHRLEHTYCPECGKIVVKRFGFDITGWYLDDHNRCINCGYKIPIVGRLNRSI
ncbi:MAG: hypothetical protein ACUVTD_05065 [Nitrososphaerales archaeon]